MGMFVPWHGCVKVRTTKQSQFSSGSVNKPLPTVISWASLQTLQNKMSTFTVGKPCCVLSFTEPRLPSVRYRARCWVSGCTTIFSSFPSLLTGYCPHNIGLFFTPAPFWLSNVLRNQSTTWEENIRNSFLRKLLKGRNRWAITQKITVQIIDKIEYTLKEETSYTTKVSLKYF